MHTSHLKQLLFYGEAEEAGAAPASAATPPPPAMPNKAAPTKLLHHLDDFTPLGSLGRGNMGTVFLVLSHSMPYALKITHSLPSKKQRSHVEREILSSLNHPFLQTLHAHFEFGNHSLFLLDFCSGGDLNLLRHRQPEKRFSETAARFYAAEILVALEHLHKLGIVYRDLKPENILLQGSGHIKLTDFDLSLNLVAHGAGKWAPDTRPPTNGTLKQHILTEAELEMVQQSGIAGTKPKKCKLGEGPKGYFVSVGGEAQCHVTMLRENSAKQTCSLCRLQCLGLNGNFCLRRRKRGHSEQGWLTRGLQQPVEKKGSTDRKANRGNKLHMRSTCFPHLTLSRDHKTEEDRYVCLVGTDEYVAPEVLRGEDQGFSMDWWSFGIFLYEMIYGHTPFKGSSSERTLCNILEREPEFPGMKTLAKQLIAQLLVKDPAKRLGTVGGAHDIKQHPFFSGLNWETLPYICRPPFIPRPLCLTELEERYSTKLKSRREGSHYETESTCKFWLDEVVESIEAAAKYEHASSQYSRSSSGGFQSSSADGADGELQRDGDADVRFSSAEWSSELEMGKHTPRLM